MNNHHLLIPAGTVPRRSVPGIDLPGRLLLILIALGLPRTILADLGIVEPESSWIYYVLALTPFAVWLAVAALRRSRTPLRDHLVTGGLYGLSLVIVHETLRVTGWATVQHPPFGRAFVIAMSIGLGFGLVAGVVAAVTNRVRTSRGR
jgi:hypothetical protein